MILPKEACIKYAVTPVTLIGLDMSHIAARPRKVEAQ